MKLLEFCKLNNKARKEYLKGKSLTADQFKSKRAVDILAHLDLELTKDWEENYSRNNTSIGYRRNYCISKEYNIWVELNVEFFKSGRGISSRVSHDYLGINLVEPGKFYTHGSDDKVQIYATKTGVEKFEWHNARHLDYTPIIDINEDFDGFIKEVIKAREDRQKYIDLIFETSDEQKAEINQILKKYGLLRDGFNRFGVVGLSSLYDQLTMQVALTMSNFNLENWLILCNIHQVLQDPDKEAIYDILEKYNITPSKDIFGKEADEFIKVMESHIEEIKPILLGSGDYNTRVTEATNKFSSIMINKAKEILPNIKKEFNIKLEDLRISFEFLNELNEYKDKLDK